MPHAGSANAVLSDFNPLLDAASPSKRTSGGTTWCIDPRVRGGGERHGGRHVQQKERVRSGGEDISSELDAVWREAKRHKAGPPVFPRQGSDPSELPEELKLVDRTASCMSRRTDLW
jgi:hypothetical protein